MTAPSHSRPTTVLQALFAEHRIPINSEWEDGNLCVNKIITNQKVMLLIIASIIPYVCAGTDYFKIAHRRSHYHTFVANGSVPYPNLPSM